ncbi:hypothetical protein H310_09622 [Aphanomyces invadans]|uniref:START domain-containing protein n=1 Tax=Aphanomyces invadans TaxID=157072 RepID=A0A024TTB7_9STRA|nr:hypothetical protein H310_09622 [Aphanomyces invadans]ETV97259.1 hypothetical protein H310_09622 [Aphanomyces invadans]|eukprot:XP_008873967.1 hypothetical protein H310_09622 [Aphanomyces invadans]
MKMTSASGTESASPTAVPKREQKARLRAYRALKKEMKEGLRETHAQLQAELQQLRKQKQQDGGKLPWKDVAQALCEDKVEVLAQHRELVKQVRRHESLVQAFHRWVLSRFLPSQIRTLPDNPMEPSSWRHTSLTRHPESRHHGMLWMVDHVQHNHERLFHLYGFSRGSTNKEPLNECMFTYKEGFQSMVRQAEFVVHASISDIDDRMGNDFMKFWYENTSDHLQIATTRVDEAAPGVFLNETVQGYAISAKIQLDANRLLCFIQAVTDEDEGEWPVHRVSQPHNRIVLVLFHQVGPTTTIIQSLYLFQSSIPEPVDVLLDKVGLTPRVETLLTTRPHHVKEYCVEDLKCRLYNQHMRSDQATSMLVYRDRWRSVFRGVHFLT